MKTNILALFCICLMVACVPAKKYNEAQRQSDRYRSQAEECKVDVNLLKKRAKQYESDIASLQSKNNSLEQDTTLQGMRIRTLMNQLAILENDLRLLAAQLGETPEYKALMQHLMQMQNSLVNSEDKRLDTEKAIAAQKKLLAETNTALAESRDEVARRENELANKQNELANKQSELANKQTELDDANERLSAAQRDIEDKAKRLAELEEALAAKDRAMAELRNTIANALVDFTSDDLTVTHKDGKVYVSLEEKLLFESGKYNVNAKGQDALRKIASVLGKQNAALNIVVEGHTDNVPFSGQVIQDNWDLSVKRATSVLRILIANGDIPQDRIQASGRADTQPVDPSNTADARRKNRRTEIILAPDVEAIIKGIESKE
ncbi:MAG: OmpA family protein [Bacteroidales bacterium]|nr:OmpA family protein [Bacteroidales bacterium]